MAEKLCIVCGSAFDTAGGRTAAITCSNTCSKQNQQQRDRRIRTKNADRIRRQDRHYRIENINKIRRRYIENREIILAKQRSKRKDNPEIFREYDRKMQSKYATAFRAVREIEELFCGTTKVSLSTKEYQEKQRAAFRLLRQLETEGLKGLLT